MSEVWVIASSSWSPKNRHEEQALFRCFKVLKILQDFPSYRIFGRMYGALNVGKK
jgi:hypothetical protein